jgi:ATP-dependent Clp protease ATP-binding subunit ClpC
MFEKFTERARKVMSLSRQESQRRNADFIGTEHILLGIVKEGAGVAVKVFKNLGITEEAIVKEVEAIVTPSTSPTATLGQLPFSPRSKRVIELAGEAASQLGSDVIGTEHLLLGLIKENEGIAAQVLTNLGMKLDLTRDMVLQITAPPPPANPEPNTFYTDIDILGTIIGITAAAFTVLQRDGTSTVVQQSHMKLPEKEIALGRRIHLTYKVRTVFLD